MGSLVHSFSVADAEPSLWLFWRDEELYDVSIVYALLCFHSVIIVHNFFETYNQCIFILFQRPMCTTSFPSREM